MASKVYTVKARRPQADYETQRHWMDVGVATLIESDGHILVRLNALPFQFDGELKLVPKDKSSKEST